METDYRNAYRYPGKGNWFDFWNCRIVIPNDERWFFIMPHIISVDSTMKGYFYYCTSDSEVNSLEISDSISVSEEKAELRWNDNLFSAQKIAISQGDFEWNFTIDTVCTDTNDPEENLRAFNVGERMLLRNLSFIHRVPTMKGRANGQIKLPNETIDLKDAIVYQAKNHGPDFPESWNWLHANVIPQFPNASFEIGMMPGKNGSEGIFRWAEKDETKFYASFLGDKVLLEAEGDHFTFSVVDKNEVEVIRGKVSHGEKKEIKFPTPNGGTFTTPESFNGYVSGNYLGKFFESNYPALGRGVKRT